MNCAYVEMCVCVRLEEVENERLGPKVCDRVNLRILVMNMTFDHESNPFFKAPTTTMP